jgi:hypothetical protein
MTLKEHIEKIDILLYLNNKYFGLFILLLLFNLELFFGTGLDIILTLQLYGLSYITCIEYYENNTKNIDLNITLVNYINFISFMFYKFILTNILYYIFGFIVYIPKVILYFYNFKKFVTYLECKKDFIVEFSQNIKNTKNTFELVNLNINNVDNFMKIVILNNFILLNICYYFNFFIFNLIFETINNYSELIINKCNLIIFYEKVKKYVYLYSGIAFWSNDILKIDIPQNISITETDIVVINDTIQNDENITSNNLDNVIDNMLNINKIDITTDTHF